MGSGAGWLAVAWSFGVLAAADEPPARGGGVLPLAAESGEPCDENARYPAAAMIVPRPRVRRDDLLCNGLPLREPSPTSPAPSPSLCIGFRGWSVTNS